MFRPDTHWVGFESDKRRQYEWDFFGADIDRPILGVDFLSAFGVAIDFSDDIVRIANSSKIMNRPAAPTSGCIGHIATVYTVRSGPSTIESCQCARRGEQNNNCAHQEDWQLVKRGGQGSIQVSRNNSISMYNRFSALQDYERNNDPEANCDTRRQCPSCKVCPVPATTSHEHNNGPEANCDTRRQCPSCKVCPMPTTTSHTAVGVNSQRDVRSSKAPPCRSGRDSYRDCNQDESYAAVCRVPVLNKVPPRCSSLGIASTNVAAMCLSQGANR